MAQAQKTATPKTASSDEPETAPTVEPEIQSVTEVKPKGTIQCAFTGGEKGHARHRERGSGSYLEVGAKVYMTPKRLEGLKDRFKRV